MQISRGAYACLQLLISYSMRSGRAYPFHKTIAVKLAGPGRKPLSLRTVKRYIAELRKAGIVTVKRHQHSSCEYQIQRCQNVTSGVTSEPKTVTSERSVSYSTEYNHKESAEEIPPSPPRRKPMQHQESPLPAITVSDSEYQAFCVRCAELRIAIPPRTLAAELKVKFVGTHNGRPAWLQLPAFPGQNSAFLWRSCERQQVFLEMLRQSNTLPKLSTAEEKKATLEQQRQLYLARRRESA